MSTDNGVSISPAFDPGFNPGVLHSRLLRAGMVSPPPVGTATPPSVATYTFSTDDLPVAERFDAWRGSFAPMLDVTQDARTDFQGSQTLWDLGGLGFSRIKTGALRFSSYPGHVRCHPLDHWVMTLLLSGQCTTTTERATFQGRPGIVQIHSLGQPYHGTVSDSEMLMLWVPRDFCRDMARILDAAEFTTLDTAMGRMFTSFMIGLAHQLTCMRVDELPRLMSATRDMILACVAPPGDSREEEGDAISGGLQERARQFVQINLFNPRLSAKLLMRELAVSRTRLYRLFEPAGGVNRYIQHRRLLDAHSALANPSEQRRILEIAEQRCFDSADFSRAFKREFGYSPSEVRKGQRIGSPNYADANLASLPPEERLGALLWRLQNGAKSETAPCAVS